MALVKGKECGGEVSSKAASCPKCGAKVPKGMSLWVKIVLALFVIGVIGQLVGKKSPESAAQATAKTAVINTQKPASAPVDPAVAAAEAARAASAAKEAAAAEEAARKAGEKALAALKKKTDKIEGIDWYYDPTTPQYNNVNNVNLYMGVKNARPWLRLAFHFQGDDWLFIQRAIVVIDGQKTAEVTGNWERDNNSEIWEWLDLSATGENLELARKMAAAKEVTVRYEGRQYYKDRTVSAKELKAMRNVLAAYDGAKW